MTPFKPPRWFPTPDARRARRGLVYLDNIVYRVIAQRRRNPGAEGKPDLLQLLLNARDEHSEGMDDRQLRDEVATMFVAGHETTSNALGWIFHLLGQHPEAAARLHAELDHVLAGRAPSAEDLPHLTYTTMVIEEALRLYPPVYRLPRIAGAEDAIRGVRVPKGSVVGVAIECIHRHPEFWEAPERFDPERFSPERARGRHRFAYLPFGGGPRVCIGQGFAMMELKLVLARLAQEFKLTHAPGATVIPMPGVTLRPAGLQMQVRTRH